MPGSTTSSRRRSPPRRDRDRDRGRRDRPSRDDFDEDRGGNSKRPTNREAASRDRRDSSAELVPYHEEPSRGRDGRPAAPRRRSTYSGAGPGDGPEDDLYDDDDDNHRRRRHSREDQKRYPPRASDTRKRGLGPPQQQRLHSESRGRSSTRDKGGGGRNGRSGSRAVSNSNSNDKGGQNGGEEEHRRKRNQAIQAALMAGALEAMRQRSEPGDWLGEKGFRVATAAVSAGLVDVGMDKDPRKGHGVGNLIKSTVGGLLIDKVANSARR